MSHSKMVELAEGAKKYSESAGKAGKKAGAKMKEMLNRKQKRAAIAKVRAGA